LFVRLDLYLRTSRLVKRRTLAKEFCLAGRVAVNGRVGEPSQPVRPGDRIAIRYEVRTIEVEVLLTPDRLCRTGAADLYRVLTDVRMTEFERGQ
jgi:ribosomal 50S subunit-recycling heat shock protein